MYHTQMTAMHLKDIHYIREDVYRNLKKSYSEDIVCLKPGNIHSFIKQSRSALYSKD